MYTRQIVTGTAFMAVFALIGLFASLPAFAYETEADDSYADFDKGMTVFVEEEAMGSPVEEASLPRHIAETIEVN